MMKSLPFRLLALAVFLTGNLLAHPHVHSNLVLPVTSNAAAIDIESFKSGEENHFIEIKWYGEKPHFAPEIEAEARLLATRAQETCGQSFANKLTLILHAPQTLKDNVVGLARKGQAFVVIDRTASATLRREMMAHEIAHLYIDGGQPPNAENVLQEAFGQVVTLKILYDCKFMRSFKSLRGRMALALMQTREITPGSPFFRYVYLPAGLVSATQRMEFSSLLQSYRSNTNNVPAFLKEVDDAELSRVIEKQTVPPNVLAGSLYGRLF